MTIPPIMKFLMRFSGPAILFSLFLPFGLTAQTPVRSAADSARFSLVLKNEVARTDSFAAILSDSFSRLTAAQQDKFRPGRLMDSAIRHSDLAMDLADSLTDRKTLGELYQQRSKLENMRHDYEQAHNFYITGWNITDSLNSQQRKNELSELKGKQDLETRDREITLHKLEASVQHRALIGLISGLVLLCLTGALLFRENRRRRRTNSTLLVLNNKLEEANKVKARFFGILSHDLRSPIANLLSFLQLMKDEPESLSTTQQADQQQEISHSAESLLETMEAMLLWSKEQMNSFRPELQEIPVNRLFRYLSKFFAGEKGVKLSFSDPDRLSITGDENYLRVIMQNLTSNAVKALRKNPDGFIEWTAGKNGDLTQISIRDNGPGLDKIKMAALFEETEAVNARTGFGFHLIRDLATAIGIGISIESAPGKGTRFSLQPVKKKQSIPVNG